MLICSMAIYSNPVDSSAAATAGTHSSSAGGFPGAGKDLGT